MPHAPDDEVLSALIDGEAVEGDAAHVADCAECQARLAELRSVVHAVATPVQLPASDVRDRAVSHALDKPAAAPLRRMNALSAAAALVLALAIGGLVLTQIDRGSNNTTARTANQLGALAPNAEQATPTAGRSGDNDVAASDAAGDTDLATKAAPAGGAAGTSEMVAADDAGYDAGDVGRYRTIDEVVKLAQSDLSKPEAEQATHVASMASTTCPPPEGSDVLWRASLYYLDLPATAEVRVLSSSRWILEIRSRDASACALLASQEFAPNTPR